MQAIAGKTDPILCLSTHPSLLYLDLGASIFRTISCALITMTILMFVQASIAQRK